MGAQPAADALGAVGPIGRHPLRAAPGPPPRLAQAHRIQRRLQLARFVRLTGEQQRRQRQALPITDQMQLGAEAAT
jgi:hypothetical protein